MFPNRWLFSFWVFPHWPFSAQPPLNKWCFQTFLYFVIYIIKHFCFTWCCIWPLSVLFLSPVQLFWLKPIWGKHCIFIVLPCQVEGQVCIFWWADPLASVTCGRSPPPPPPPPTQHHNAVWGYKTASLLGALPWFFNLIAVVDGWV